MTDGDRPARRAADRGRYGRLSRERVPVSALELVDREGLSALRMRRLGAELRVEAMGLYRYAAGKDELLDGLVEAPYLRLDERLGDESGGGDRRSDSTASPGRRTTSASPSRRPSRCSPPACSRCRRPVGRSRC